MKRICVFCGSSPGSHPEYAMAAQNLGRILAEHGIGLVYGGGNIGLMGILADSVLAGGGSVTGVIPHALMEREVGHRGLLDLRVVDSMHERKALMADLADAFLALPGGIGTLEEFCEIVTWQQLGMHSKPCGLLNVAGYFDGLLRFLDHAVEDGFYKPEHRALVLVDKDPIALLGQFARYKCPVGEKWIDRSTV